VELSPVEGHPNERSSCRNCSPDFGAWAARPRDREVVESPGAVAIPGNQRRDDVAAPRSARRLMHPGTCPRLTAPLRYGA
jgi:hypothetical protein